MGFASTQVLTHPASYRFATFPDCSSVRTAKRLSALPYLLGGHIYKQLVTAQPSGTPHGHIYTRQTIALGFCKRMVFMLWYLSFLQ